MLFLLLVAIIFGSQNHQLITLNYLVAQTQITVANAVVIFTLIGFVLGFATCLLWRLMAKFRHQQQLKHQRDMLD